MNILVKTNLKTKIVALALAVTTIVVPIVSCFVTKTVKAETIGTLSVGDMIAQDERNIVVKDTIRVKRWHEYVFTLYYEGTFDDVFVAEVHTPLYVTGKTNFEYTYENQIINNYSLTTTVTEKITDELEVQASINLPEFLDNAKGYAKVTSSHKEEYAKTVAETVGKTNISIYTEKQSFTVDGTTNMQYNRYYGDLLMMAKANKFRLHVHKIKTAKYRKSALHKWSPYQTDATWDEDYYFYSSYYNTSANFYRLMPNLGTRDEYLRIISNEGK